jgi:hypothetical protein
MEYVVHVPGDEDFVVEASDYQIDEDDGSLVFVDDENSEVGHIVGWVELVGASVFPHVEDDEVEDDDEVRDEMIEVIVELTEALLEAEDELNAYDGE